MGDTTQRTRSVFCIVCLYLLAIQGWQQSFLWLQTQCKVVLINICSATKWMVRACDCLDGGGKGEGNKGDSLLTIELPILGVNCLPKRPGEHAGKSTKPLIAIVGFAIEKSTSDGLQRPPAQVRSSPWSSRAWSCHILDCEHFHDQYSVVCCSTVLSLARLLGFLFGRGSVQHAWVPPHEWHFGNTRN